MSKQTDIAKVPKLRFPGFEGDWTENYLGQLAEFSKGKGISKSDIDDRGALECVRYGELYTEYTEVIDSVKSRTNLNKENLVLSERNDIIIPSSGESEIDIATASCVLRDGVALGGDLNIIKTEVDGVFLSYYLNSEKKYDIARFAQGNSVVHLYAKHLRKLHLRIPSKSEQTKIASSLSAVDKKISQLERKRELLEQYKKGCMQKLFSQEIRFKDENGNDFPDWEEKRISEVFKITRGQVLAASETDEYTSSDNPFPVYSSQTKNNGLMGYYSEYLFDTALTWTTDGANAGDVKFRPGKFYCTNVCGVLLSTEGHSNYCIAELLDRETHKYVSYVGNPKLMNNVMGGIKISFPSLEEQLLISQAIYNFNSKIETISTVINRSIAFKKGLLQQMFV